MLRFNMQSFYVKTKLFIPVLRTQLVERTRLLEKLTQGYKAYHRLLLISAPAGFGKTTLVRAWLETIQTPVAWYSLDPDDHHPRQFLHYLINAVSQALPTLADSLQNVTLSTPQPSAEFILTLLINEITEAGLPLVIVLDDYHHIESEPVNHTLNFLMDHLPENVSLVLTTRTKPELPLSRLRARSQITEVTAQDLRFTMAEMEDFFQLNCGLRLPPDLLLNLDQKTEGWAAGLQLAAMTFQGETEVSQIIHNLDKGNHLILDYLADEVLADQPDELQNFLLGTAILDRVSAPLAAALLEQDIKTAQSTLETLEQKNLFVFALDHQRYWYRYHPLFSDLLLKRLQESAPEKISELHHRASTWFESEGMVDKAVKHSLSASDDSRAIALIENHAESLLLAGKYIQYLELVASLPTQLRDQSPTILIYQATAMLFSEHPRQAILNVLAQADSLDISSQWDGEISAIRAIIQSYACAPEKGIALSKRALTKIDPSHTFYRNLVERNLGVAYTLMNNIEDANIWFEKLLLSSAKLEDWGGMLAAYNYLTFIRQAQGRLIEASVIYRKALSFIEEKRLELMPHSIKIIAGYGYLLLHWNRIEDAKSAFKRAIQLAKKTDILYAHTAYQNLSEALIRENDLRSALSIIQELRHQAQGRQDFYQHIHNQHNLALEAQIHLEAGRVDLAYDWLMSTGFGLYSAEELLARYGLELGYILPVAAKIYLAKGQHEHAIRLLESAIPKFIHLGANACLICAFSVLAVAYHQTGHPEKAIKPLTKAIYLAEAEENFGDFMIAGTTLIPLLDERLSAGIAPAFTSQLLTIFTDLESSRKPPVPNLYLVDPLSRREMDVLQLIALGMTNREIANELYLSTNTIKSHSIKIYRKLSVNSRNQAVSKARQMGILPSHSTGNFGSPVSAQT